MNTSRFAYVWSDEMLGHFGPDSTFECPERIAGVTASLALEYKHRLVPTIDDDSLMSLIQKVHARAYIAALKSAKLNLLNHDSKWGCSRCSYVNVSLDTRCEMCFTTKPTDERRWLYMDQHLGDTTYYNLNTVNCSLMATRCAVTLAQNLVEGNVETGFAIVRPPGHHAGRENAEGFCILNNTAIAAEAALESGAKRVFIFDWDLHHGNGIENHIMTDGGRSDIFYASIHCGGIYPWTGTADNEFVMNAQLPAGTTDEMYIREFRRRVLSALVKYDPDVILIAAGFDGLATDPMGIFKLTPNIYKLMLEEMGGVCVAPIGCILEGGYDATGVAKSIKTCIDTLCMSA